MDSNSGILSENTKANYTERYDSLLKMKNHVNTHHTYILLLQQRKQLQKHVFLSFIFKDKSICSQSFVVIG